MSEKCKTCNQTVEYQGWRNYETWAFALWLDNEQTTYLYWRGAARVAREDAKTHSNVTDGIWPSDRAAVYILSDRLKEWAEGSAPDLGASVWSDLLSAALSSVDWQEIAEHYLEEE